MKKLTLITLIGLLLLALPVRAQINLLHEFAGGAADGAHPNGSLILSGSTIYGMTLTGGNSGNGVIFKMETDGSGFTLLHEFSVGINEGVNPVGSLLISGSTLFGMTELGGNLGKGTIFKIETNGTGFTLLHDFIGGAGDGQNPGKSLILSGSTLYGMTAYGGDSDFGTIFKIETDGSDFALLHEFTGYPVDGANPEGSLLILDSTLYGMTRWGGDSDNGTIFKIQTDGSGFVLLHLFAGYHDDGQDPLGSLIIYGSILYGMTDKGGANEGGTIFKIQTDGSDFALLHSFDNTSGDDGCFPMEDLIISGSTLYGMTSLGGGSSGGTLFKVQADGTGFTLLHEFSTETYDGYYPYGSLAISGFTLFGMTSWGGKNDMGVVFSLTLPSITVTSPNGGESWNSGTNHNITWTSTGPIANINIDYSTNNGGNWSSLVANTANDGSYPWTIPNTPSSQCLIKISDATNTSTSDTSNAMFSIIFNVPPQVKIVSPENGASVYGIVTIMANATDDRGVARVEFYVDGVLHGPAATAQTAFQQTRLASGTSENSKITKKILLNSVDPNQGANIFSVNSQYSFTWNTMDTSSGSHVLRVVAFDEDGAMGFAEITVQVLKVNLDLLAERREIKAFSILRYYGQIQFTVDNPGIPVSQYRIMRRQGSGDFVLLKTVTPQELQNNQFQMQDKYLAKDIQYTYRVEAYNGAGQLIGLSDAKTI